MRKDMELLHPSTGKPMAANNLGEALQLIVIETLHEPLIWPAVVQEMVSKLKGKSTVIFNVGPVRAADSLIRKMNAQGVKLLDNTEIQALGDSPSHNSSSDIAIVGFASRLPESETLEEAWETLEKGRDTHKKVSSRYERLQMLTVNLTLTNLRSLRTDSTSTLTAIHLARSRTP